MKKTWKRKFPTYEDAVAYMEASGKLEYFGVQPLPEFYYIYGLTLPDGRKYHVDMYKDGRVEVREFGVLK